MTHGPWSLNPLIKSPIIKPITIRVLFTLALHYGWNLRQVDINNAFLHGILEDEVYMTQPPGMIDKSDPTNVWSSSSMIDRLVFYLNNKFSLKDLGLLNYFLGVEVSYPKFGGLFLSQKKYIVDLLYKAKMQNTNVIATPIVSGSVLSAFHGERFVDVRLYRSIVGALQYITLTRREISYSVNKVCQFIHSPNRFHWQVVKRILRYLAGTLEQGLLFKKPKDLTIQGFVDADWASDPDDGKSTFGVCVYFGGT
ncbi:uncharacterized mitochondrial protein AtMg00810-like [Benincasa hispida]|uniref:uncharacterized mitochondrial protein AtMg00810-like n=1 Tax=Benincasa hispida TaxID=102211 RepID=UPI0019020084|nr:uncharacterized mitochondrial protein AtMg00810-like [Benincasa hispida]